MKTTIKFPDGEHITTFMPIDMHINHFAVARGNLYRVVSITHYVDQEFERIVIVENT